MPHARGNEGERKSIQNGNIRLVLFSVYPLPTPFPHCFILDRCFHFGYIEVYLDLP
jgi:hypothetical protein